MAGHSEDAHINKVRADSLSRFLIIQIEWRSLDGYIVREQFFDGDRSQRVKREFQFESAGSGRRVAPELFVFRNQSAREVEDRASVKDESEREAFRRCPRRVFYSSDDGVQTCLELVLGFAAGGRDFSECVEKFPIQPVIFQIVVGHTVPTAEFALQQFGHDVVLFAGEIEFGCVPRPPER